MKDIVSFHPLPQLGKEVEGNDEGMNKFYSTLDEKINGKNTVLNHNVCNLLDKVKNCKDLKDVELTIKKFFATAI